MQGVSPTAITEQTVAMASQLLDRFCQSQVLLVGLLPVVENAKYYTYEYKSVSPGAETKQHFAKISSINEALATFASGRPRLAFAGCHDLFLDRADERNIDRLLLKDGIHFTQPGVQLFFRCLEDFLSVAEQRNKVCKLLPSWLSKCRLPYG